MSDWFDGAGHGNPVDVGALMDSGVPTFIAGIVSAGALVSIGTTSDGGAVGITVTLDGRWRREYFRESEAACDWLSAALDAVTTAQASPPAPPASRRRRQKSS